MRLCACVCACVFTICLLSSGASPREAWSSKLAKALVGSMRSTCEHQAFDIWRKSSGLWVLCLLEIATSSPPSTSLHTYIAPLQGVSRFAIRVVPRDIPLRAPCSSIPPPPLRSRITGRRACTSCTPTGSSTARSPLPRRGRCRMCSGAPADRTRATSSWLSRVACPPRRRSTTSRCVCSVCISSRVLHSRKRWHGTCIGAGVLSKRWCSTGFLAVSYRSHRSDSLVRIIEGSSPCIYVSPSSFTPHPLPWPVRSLQGGANFRVRQRSPQHHQLEPARPLPAARR